MNPQPGPVSERAQARSRVALIRWPLWRRFGGYIGRSPALLGSLAVLGALQSLLILPTLLLVRYCFDVAIPEHLPRDVILVGLAIFFIRLLASGLFLFTRFMSIRLAKSAVRRMRQDLIDWLYRTPRDFLARNDAGWVQGRIVHETERIDNLTSTLISVSLPTLLTIAALLAALFWISWQLTLLAIVLAPAAWVLTLLAGRLVKREVGAFQHSFERFNQGVSFVVRQMDLTRTRGFAEQESRQQGEKLKTLERSGVRMAMSFAVHGQLQSTVVGAVGLCLLVAGALATIAGWMSIGDLLAFYLGAGFLNGAVSQVTNILPDVLTADESLARLDQLQGGVGQPAYSGRAEPDFGGRIALSAVSFGYGPSPLIEDLSLELRPGDNVAIIGPNGSGKTTITDLILGFLRPSAGQVTADGRPYDELDLSALRRSIGVVPQLPTFFTGTVADNLKYGWPELQRADIEAAAARAGIDDFIQRLPQGYETPIGEGGLLVSGGEAQRLAIARALVGRPRLLILDEPTNHMDTQGVADVMRRLLSGRDGLGILTITHDITVVALADKVFRLTEGRLVAQHPQQDVVI